MSTDQAPSGDNSSTCSCTSSCCERAHGKKPTAIKFHGSSADTVAYANTFWQSVHMVPAPESGLCCGSISQRLKRAPPGHQPVNIQHPPQELTPQQAEFLQRLRDEEELDQFTRLQEVKDRQDRQRGLFRKQRTTNQAMAEMLAQGPKPRQ